LDTAAAHVANGSETEMGHRHAVSNGDEGQPSAKHRNGHANRNHNTVGLPDTHADEYSAAVGSDCDHGSIVPGRRAIENAHFNSHSHAAAYRDGNARATGNGDEYPFTYGNPHGDSVVNALPYSDLHGDSVAYADAYVDADAYANTHAFANGQHHAYTNSNTHGHAAALSLPVVWQRVVKR
jgi:hypothetical protein